LNSPVHIDSDTQGQVLEINMSLKTGVVEARVVNDTQQSVQGASVVIVPDPSRRSRSELYKEARSDSSGRVRFEGVAPGEYKLFASQNVTLTDWQSPSVISLYESRGELVRIEENGRQEVTLKAITSRP
jgi:hypothetical protein